MEVGPRHELIDHTGEVEIHLEAPDLPSLFAEAGRALAELMLRELPTASGGWEEIAVRGRDRESVLVDFLNELIFRGEVEGKVFTRFEIEQAGSRAVVGRIGGVETEELATSVKAATFHGLEIEERPGGFSANVVLDV